MEIPKRKFIFIRHGQAEHNLTLRMVSRTTPSPLTEKGVAQAHTAAQKLAGQPIVRIFSSPIPRALETATIINRQFNLPLVEADFLLEQAYGAWSDRLYKEVCAETGIDPETFDYLFHVPANGESWQALQNRVGKGLAETLAQYPDELLLFVAHGGTFNAVCNLLLGSIEETANATPYLVEPTATGWRIKELGAA